MIYSQPTSASFFFFRRFLNAVNTLIATIVFVQVSIPEIPICLISVSECLLEIVRWPKCCNVFLGM